MKKSLFKLSLVVISIMMISACNDAKQEQKKPETIENHTSSVLNDDCLDEVTTTSNEFGTIEAKGCAINIK